MSSLLTKELIRKYIEVIKQAWIKRNKVKNIFHRDELEFLPAVLEIQSMPPHPLPRLILWLLSGFILISIAWSIIGKVDIIATAQGKVIPSDFVKYIQPVNTASINKIMVSDGQHVNKGQLLVELDSTISIADVKKLQNDYVQSSLEVIRYQNLLNKLDDKPLQVFPESGIFTPQVVANSRNQFNNQWLELQNKLLSLKSTQQRYDESIRTLNTLLIKYQKTLPILREKESDYLALYEKKFMSQHGYLDMSKERIDLQQNLAEVQGKIKEVRAQKQELNRQSDLIVASFRTEIGDKLLNASQQSISHHEEMIKAKQSQIYTKLTAPVSGYVTQLNVHTIGGVVTAAQPLMAIVPEKGGLMVQVQLENKDIGFVKVGQEAEIKITAFPFTRYGTLHGIVNGISADALQNSQEKQKELLYNVYIKLDQNAININGYKQALSPGMMVIAEIKTGKRRLISYFLSPLIQRTTEALHER